MLSWSHSLLAILFNHSLINEQENYVNQIGFDLARGVA